MEEFDVVIPYGPFDKQVIDRTIKYTKANVIGYRKIYIISYTKNFHHPDCTTIHEREYPFTVDDVASIHGQSMRNGWYLQQLLKLYAGVVIPDILLNYLVIDADTTFLKPTTFIEDGKHLFNYSGENHGPYYKHMTKVIPGLMKQKDISGICHHMMISTEVMREMIAMVEEIHGKPFWRVYLECVNRKNYLGSGAADYEIYFNYVLKYHPDMVKIRRLVYRDTGIFEEDPKCDYISVHHYMRKVDNKIDKKMVKNVDKNKGAVRRIIRGKIDKRVVIRQV